MSETAFANPGRPLKRALALACAGCAGVLLAACGTSNSASTVETVTVIKTDTTGTQTTTLPRTQTGAATTPTTSTPAAKTRTATAPSFTGGTASGTSGGLSSAVAKLHALGFSPLATSTYNANQTLRVLIGARSGSADARTQQAFFFNGSKYLGTDTQSTSAEIRVSGQSDTSVTLSYGIYKKADPLCCPTGGTRNVHFQLDMGKLMAVDAIPSVAQRR